MMPNKHPNTPTSLVFANAAGEITDYPELDMAGRSGSHFSRPSLEDLIKCGGR